MAVLPGGITPPPLHPEFLTIQDPATEEYFHLAPPPTEERDIALGQIIDVFGQLEDRLFLNFALLFGIPHNEVRQVLYNILDAQSLRNALLSLSIIRLNIDGQKEMEKIVSRAKDVTAKRNRIIHGTWRCEFRYTGKEKPPSVRWIRQYDPTNAMERDQLAETNNNQKIQSKYRFDIPHLKRISSDIAKLVNDLGEFYDRFRDQYPKML